MQGTREGSRRLPSAPPQSSCLTHTHPEASGLPLVCPDASGDEQPLLELLRTHFQSGGFSGYNVIFHVLPLYLPMFPPGPVVHGGALPSTAPAHPWREAAPGLPQHAGEPAECHERLLLARALFLRQGKKLLVFPFSPLQILKTTLGKSWLGMSREHIPDLKETLGRGGGRP